MQGVFLKSQSMGRTFLGTLATSSIASQEVQAVAAAMATALRGMFPLSTTVGEAVPIV